MIRRSLRHDIRPCRWTAHEAKVEVLIEPRDAAFRGSKTFNSRLLPVGKSGARVMTGGVTLTATKA